jgi:hypothetical protein
MNLDKYSSYLYRYMKKININLKTKISIDHEIIYNLLNISKTIFNEKIIIPIYQIKNIKKLHNKNDYPLYYELFKQKYPEIKMFKDFIRFYTKNQHECNLYEINNILINKYKLINQERSELVQYFYNNFLSIDIIQEIESNDLKNIVLQNNYYRVSLYYYNIDDDNINIELEKIIKIINLIRAINKFYNINKYDFFNVIIFLSNRKKYLFDKTKLISPMNINSGATISLQCVTVWRKEELEKVLIHELLHYIQLDYELFENNHLCNDINNMFNVFDLTENKTNENRINESYNESVATIINMCWKSIKYNLTVQDIYETEMKFLLYQTSKIIKYFNGNNGEDLFNININQTTSFLSYIILKMILFYNINVLLDFMTKINFKMKEENIKEYNDILKLMINKKDYIKDIDNILKLKFNTRFLNKTVRMSVL